MAALRGGVYSKNGVPTVGRGEACASFPPVWRDAAGAWRGLRERRSLFTFRGLRGDWGGGKGVQGG